ncbi:MAG: hypothetical protein J6V90_08295 [Treponema sp.]|nr:hypothetical protein [Treponema sp.]
MGALTIAFIVLKLTKVIDWSWGWVLPPIWITAGVVVLILLALGILTFLEEKKNEKKR